MKRNRAVFAAASSLLLALASGCGGSVENDDPAAIGQAGAAGASAAAGGAGAAGRDDASGGGGAAASGSAGAGGATADEVCALACHGTFSCTGTSSLSGTLETTGVSTCLGKLDAFAATFALSCDHSAVFVKDVDVTSPGAWSGGGESFSLYPPDGAFDCVVTP